MRTHPDVAILSLNYPPEPTGIAPYSGALAAGLSERGLRVDAHVAHPHYPEWAIRQGYGQWLRTDRIDGVEVRRRLHYVPKSPRGIKRLVSEVTYGVRLLFARFGRPRVVVAVSPSLFSTAIASVRLRLSPRRPQLIVWVQDIYTLGLAETGEGSGLAQRFIRWVEATTLRAADRVVVIHERFANYVVSELGVEASRVTVVRNWTHLPPSVPLEATIAKDSLHWPKNVTLAVHTGNMGAKQGLENILDAARLADEQDAPVHFMLIGDGGEKRGLVAKATGIKRLSFIDPLDDTAYRAALAAADVLIVNEKPGVAAMAVPSKLTSYFDAGRPVIGATDFDGITASEIKASEAGLVVRAGDPGALLTAVLALRADPDASARFGRNGRRYRESVLDQSAAIQRWDDLLKTLST
ncbi:glycosyltransferase family 4 protein [Mycolicibacterium vinylchloridicum]|uniref:glycosyltransferase family 4 protein n=1 Tax=Mycolicibacterium vinylchloridicum TaxID=2736928 RepID=UPI0015CC7546|nr:glycosyltransferase family 4 protein [Mycolicibacterium vinylchloridicum]